MAGHTQSTPNFAKTIVKTNMQAQAVFQAPTAAFTVAAQATTATDSQATHMQAMPSFTQKVGQQQQPGGQIVQKPKPTAIAIAPAPTPSAQTTATCGLAIQNTSGNTQGQHVSHSQGQPASKKKPTKRGRKLLASKKKPTSSAAPAATMGIHTTGTSGAVAVPAAMETLVQPVNPFPEPPASKDKNVQALQRWIQHYSQQKV
jgi:hypothetical protein